MFFDKKKKKKNLIQPDQVVPEGSLNIAYIVERCNIMTLGLWGLKISLLFKPQR